MTPTIGVVEIVPITVLIGACLALTIFAGPAMGYFEAAAAELHNPIAYVHGVVSSPSVPYPGRGALP
jgi:multicomponent K+:H+ antiporter subunit D